MSSSEPAGGTPPQTSSPEIRVYGAAGEPVTQGKFLQLVWCGREHLVFAPRERHQFHVQILAAFAAQQGLPCRWEDATHLHVDDPRLRVLGGGRYRLDGSSGVLELYDDSHVFGRFQDDGLATRLAGAAHPWSRLSVRIR